MASRWSFHNHSWLTRQLSPEEWAKTMLRNAGNPISFSQYRNVKEGVMRLFSLLLFFFFLFGNPTGRNIFLFLFYFAFFFSLLDLVLQITKERREKILTRQVPYFIDLFILTLRTGLNIEQTLWCVTEKESLLTVTVRRKLEELNLGRSLHEIFEDLEAEVRNEEFQNFLRSVRQSQTLGVSLAYTLEIQSQLIRTKRKQRAEEISRTAAVKISLPLVLFIFPALLIIYIGPGILNVL
jgi:tight adherence protein C